MAQGSLTEPTSDKAAPAGRGDLLRAILAGLFIASSFLFFTWRALTVYYTGDDLMNLYGYLEKPVSALVKGNLFFWTPYYRPFGGIIYRSVYAIFGLNPVPLYALFLIVLVFNLYIAYLLLKRLGGSREIGALATLLYSFHGKMDYLYYNAGSMYDAFCFLFYSLTFIIYLRARLQNRLLNAWETVGFLASFICALNSKEMAATLPVMVLIWELLYHPPDFSKISALWRWCFREGRMALVGALCVLIYIPAKVSTQGLAASPNYIPHYTWHQYVMNTGYYLANLLYRTNHTVELGVTPYKPLQVLVIYGTLTVIALLMRSRRMWFGLLFFAIGLLPVSFVTPRLGFVLYLPLAGMALYVAVFLVRIKDKLRVALPGFSQVSPIATSVGLFVTMAVVISVINYRNWQRAPDGRNSAFRQAATELPRLCPTLPHGAKLLFIHTPFDNNWDLVFFLRLHYRDNSLFITLLNGPTEQRIPIQRLGHYDHIFTFDDDHYVELDNTDAYRTVGFNLRKEASLNPTLGEAMTIGKPGAAQYIVKGVQVGRADESGYWTLDQPEFHFQLASTDHHWFMERFFLPRETLQKTGPLHVDFFVNDHLLDQAVFAKDGNTVYQHDVPASWLSTAGFTKVRMFVHNPYISPPYGDRLGVLILDASFNPMPSPAN